MNQRIQVLPPAVVDQIAAGEVVERPASVLKELVENSLDAEATEISVQARGSGVSRISVSDNGAGMARDEALEALKRHATSKIRSIQDLMELRSLGFRGEALCSIAAVSRLELITRGRDAIEGTRIRVEAGCVEEVSQWGAPPGTSVQVEDLFFNVPARRKFLRSTATETQHLREVLERMAMAKPSVGFLYEYEGRKVVDCPPAAARYDRIRQLWGATVSENLYPFALEEADLSVEGFLSHPNYHRASSTHLWFYVNGRPVQDRGILYAVLRGYGPLLERGRYPVGIVEIKLHPAQVDVNVHPAKREVRFRAPQRVHGTVAGGVRRFLREQPWVELAAAPPRKAGPGRAVFKADAKVSEPAAPFRAPGAGTVRKPTVPSLFDRGPVPTAEEEPHRFLGQVGGAYLAFSGPNGLLLLDQHAAHERILFEQLKERLRAGGGTQAQGLLWDELVELDSAEGRILERIRGTLETLGWMVEPFGGDSWRIRALPSWMDPAGASRLLRELCEQCAQLPGVERWEDLERHVLVELACRAAVKSGRTIREAEAMALLHRMRQTPEMGLCPHGRPTLLEIPFSELAKRFGRT